MSARRQSCAATLALEVPRYIIGADGHILFPAGFRYFGKSWGRSVVTCSEEAVSPAFLVAEDCRTYAKRLVPS